MLVWSRLQSSQSLYIITMWPKHTAANTALLRRNKYQSEIYLVLKSYKTPNRVSQVRLNSWMCLVGPRHLSCFWVVGDTTLSAGCWTTETKPPTNHYINAAPDRGTESDHQELNDREPPLPVWLSLLTFFIFLSLLLFTELSVCPLSLVVSPLFFLTPFPPLCLSVFHWAFISLPLFSFIFPHLPGSVSLSVHHITVISADLTSP